MPLCKFWLVVGMWVVARLGCVSNLCHKCRPYLGYISDRQTVQGNLYGRELVVWTAVGRVSLFSCPLVVIFLLHLWQCQFFFGVGMQNY